MAPTPPGPQASVCHPGASTGAFELADPARAADAWATVDHRVTDAAAWCRPVSMRVVELTSRRLRNYQYNPVWGFLADQSWVR